MTTSPKRPIAITVICIIAFIGIIPSVFLAFTPIAASLGTWYPPYLLVSALIGLCCFIGLWKMKKWAIIAYTAFVILNSSILYSQGLWNVLALLLPGIVIAIGFSQYKKMT